MKSFKILKEQKTLDQISDELIDSMRTKDAYIFLTPVDKLKQFVAMDVRDFIYDDLRYFYDRFNIPNNQRDAQVFLKQAKPVKKLFSKNNPSWGEFDKWLYDVYVGPFTKQELRDFKTIYTYDHVNDRYGQAPQKQAEAAHKFSGYVLAHSMEPIYLNKWEEKKFFKTGNILPSGHTYNAEKFSRYDNYGGNDVDWNRTQVLDTRIHANDLYYVYYTGDPKTQTSTNEYILKSRYDFDDSEIMNLQLPNTNITLAIAVSGPYRYLDEDSVEDFFQNWPNGFIGLYLNDPNLTKSAGLFNKQDLGF